MEDFLIYLGGNRYDSYTEGNEETGKEVHTG